MQLLFFPAFTWFILWLFLLFNERTLHCKRICWSQFCCITVLIWNATTTAFSLFLNWSFFLETISGWAGYAEGFSKKTLWGFLVRDLYGLDVLPVTQSAVSQYWREYRMLFITASGMFNEWKVQIEVVSGMLLIVWYSCGQIGWMNNVIVSVRVLARRTKIFRWTMLWLIVLHASSHSRTLRVVNGSLQLLVGFGVSFDWEQTWCWTFAKFLSVCIFLISFVTVYADSYFSNHHCNCSFMSVCFVTSCIMSKWLSYPVAVRYCNFAFDRIVLIMYLS